MFARIKPRRNTRSRAKKKEMSEKKPPEHEKQGKNKRNGRKNPHHKLLSDEKMYKTKI